MNIQFENWGIVEMNYSLLSKKERRDENTFSLRFEKVFGRENKKSFKIILLKRETSFFKKLVFNLPKTTL